MIAFTQNRGRPIGSKSRESRPSHQRVPGAASSAASTGCRSGVRPLSGAWLYVPREGFVRWSEIEEQIYEAWLAWRRKKALQGIRIMDGWEWREEQIAAAVAQRRARRAAAYEEATLKKLTEHPMDVKEAREFGVFVDIAEEAA